MYSISYIHASMTLLNDDFLSECDLPDVPQDAPTPVSPNRWPPQLVFDLALGLDDNATIEQRYNLTQEQLQRLFALPLFRQEVALLMRELREKNTIFRNKAKVQAETYLETLDELMYDAGTPASTKLAIFQTLAKYGDLEPKELRSEKDSSAQVVIRIESNVRDPLIDITPRAAEIAHAS